MFMLSWVIGSNKNTVQGLWILFEIQSTIFLDSPIVFCSFLLVDNENSNYCPELYGKLNVLLALLIFILLSTCDMLCTVASYCSCPLFLFPGQKSGCIMVVENAASKLVVSCKCLNNLFQRVLLL